MAHIEKKPFNKKWKKNASGEWEGKWQTKGDVAIPDNMPEHMEHLRIWVFEMSEWAEQVNNDWDEVSQLSGRMDHISQQLSEMGEALSKLRKDIDGLMTPATRPA